MFTEARNLALASLVLALGGCGALQNPYRTSRTQGGIRNESGATIISGVALDDQRGTLIDTMDGRVPGMKILRSKDQCPRVILRSHVTFQSAVAPLVYVDGTRTSDTCILESLLTDNVESVEIYPMGFTKRPGYATHAHGLILVFMRGASE